MEIKAARLLVNQAELRLPSHNALANSSQEQVKVDYTVLKIFIRPGEFITQLPILQVGNLHRMACVAEVYEADAKQIQIGQKARLRSPAFSGEFSPHAQTGKKGTGKGGIQGTVRRISNLITSPGLADRNPLAPMDRSVIQVLIEIDNNETAACQEAAKLVGLQVTVEFEPATDRTTSDDRTLTIAK